MVENSHVVERENLAKGLFKRKKMSFARTL